MQVTAVDTTGRNFLGTVVCLTYILLLNDRADCNAERR